jgi:hypothetical protein
VKVTLVQQFSNLENLSVHITNLSFLVGCVVQVVERLPSTCKALSLNPSTTHTCTHIYT